MTWLPAGAPAPPAAVVGAVGAVGAVVPAVPPKVLDGWIVPPACVTGPRAGPHDSP